MVRNPPIDPTFRFHGYIHGKISLLDQPIQGKARVPARISISGRNGWRFRTDRFFFPYASAEIPADGAVFPVKRVLSSLAAFRIVLLQADVYILKSDILFL